jgi:hypothetical protein
MTLPARAGALDDALKSSYANVVVPSSSNEPTSASGKPGCKGSMFQISVVVGRKPAATGKGHRLSESVP